MDPVLMAFAEELEKRAISVGLLQRTLAGRAAQGVGGAAALGRQVAGAAAGGATTARQALAQGGGLARHRLQAVQQGGLAARQTAQQFGPAQAALKGRINAAEGPGMLNQAKPLRTHEGYMGNEHAYSQSYGHAIARPQGALSDPKGLMAASPAARVVQGTAPAAQQGATAVVGRRGLAPRRMAAETTQIAPTMIAPMSAVRAPVRHTPSGLAAA
jgi:hypothetical protein